MSVSRRWPVALVWVVFIAALLVGDLRLTAADKPADRVLRAGAATSNITPPLGELVVGGFAPFPATNIHDELHARCLVLDNGQTQIAFVICDSLKIGREVYDRARIFIGAETGLPPQNVLMAATHTHSSISASEGWYPAFLARRIADGIRRALANMEPAKIGFGGVAEPSQVFNRRWFVSDSELLKNPFGKLDKVRMNPPRGNPALVKPAGPTDPEISFLSVQSIDGRPIALLANYSLHYVGGVNKGDVSADYFGIFSERIAALLKARPESPPFVGMLSNGTSGDINNVNFREAERRYRPYEKMTRVAELVAQRVAEAHEQVEFRDWVPLGLASRELTVKVRKPDEETLSYFATVMAQPEEAPPKHHAYERIYADRARQLAEGPDDVTFLLQAVRIGDLAIGAIPFEVFAEIGLQIKQKSPFADTFTIELANGSHGYLPTPGQHELGGYETWLGSNRVQLDTSEQITKIILDLMGQLKAADAAQ